MKKQVAYRWGILWRSKNKLDGERQHFCWENGVPAMFYTKASAKAFINDRYGYIRERKDLRTEPHGWLMPIPCRMVITLTKDPRHAD